MPDSWGGVEVVEATLLFDNNKEYVISSKFTGSEQRGMQRCIVEENEALLSGNPIGILSSNQVSLELFDANNYLSPSNEQSPYFGYMRNGVEIRLRLSYDNGDTWTNYGVYFVNNWSTPYEDGFNSLTYIDGADRLQYIGNLEIPKLPAYSGVKMGELIDNVFKAIGLITDEYMVDSSLNLDMVYGITPGTKLRDFLNQVTQALIARVTINRDGIIEIRPALRVYGERWSLTDEYIINAASQHNNTNIYNKVKVIYDKPGSTTLDVILTVNGLILNTGLNKFENLRFNTKALTIDQVYFEIPDKVQGQSTSIVDISWQAYQSGIDVQVTNNGLFDIMNATLYIEGKLINSTEASVESIVEGVDAKVANTLELRNNLIQDRTQAQSISNLSSLFIAKTTRMLKLDTTLTPYATVGDGVTITSSVQGLTGEFKIIESRATHGINYSKTLTLIQEEKGNVWEDNTNWNDSTIWLD